MKTDIEAESEMLSQVNSELSQKLEGVRINNRNLENVHPSDCRCTICLPYYPEGIPSIIEEDKRREKLDYEQT
jgi:hypothetical protein